jgi:hypothetical protein
MFYFLIFTWRPTLASSIEEVSKSDLRWNEVDLPEAVMTGNNVTRSDRVRMRNRFPRFFLTTVVVQNIPLRMTNMATECNVTKGHVIPKGFPWKGGVRACAIGICAVFSLVGSFHRKWHHQTSRDPKGIPLEAWGARMCNRKLCNIRLNVIRRASLGKYGSAHARPEVPSRTPGSYNLIIFYELVLSLVISPFPPFYFHGAFNNYTTIFSGVV